MCLFCLCDVICCSLHPRYKRQVADRLALAGLAVAYGDESEGLWQGPLPTAFTLDAGNLVVTLADGQVPLEARDTDTSVHYEVCTKTVLFAQIRVVNEIICS